MDDCFNKSWNETYMAPKSTVLFKTFEALLGAPKGIFYEHIKPFWNRRMSQDVICRIQIAFLLVVTTQMGHSGLNLVTWGHLMTFSGAKRPDT